MRQGSIKRKSSIAETDEGVLEAESDDEDSEQSENEDESQYSDESEDYVTKVEFEKLVKTQLGPLIKM